MVEIKRARDNISNINNKPAIKRGMARGMAKGRERDRERERER